MWLKEAIEKQYLKHLKEYYSAAHRRFMLKEGLQTHPSYTNPSHFHMAGYVEKSYNINGTTYLELKTSSNDILTITTPNFTSVQEMKFQSVLCEDVVEHENGIIDNSVFQRTCSRVVVL